jgi:hypothetical protein
LDRVHLDTATLLDTKIRSSIVLGLQSRKEDVLCSSIFWLTFRRKCIFFTENKLEADWKQTESRLEADWKQTGSRLETDWKQTGSRLETDWKQTLKSKLEAELTQVGPEAD